MNSKIQDFYLTKDEPNQSCLLTLRDILLNFDEDIEETIKYGMPCFLYKGKMFCYLWIDKIRNYPYLLFVEGKHLNYPQLELGTRKRMKTLPINPNEDIQVELLHTILSDAIGLYKEGIIKTPR